MLREFQNHIAAKIPYRTGLRICCFYVPNRGRVVEAFKRVISEDMALTGEEFCALLGLDYAAIVERRSADQVANLDYFSERLGAIEAVRERLLSVLDRPGGGETGSGGDQEGASPASE